MSMETYDLSGTLRSWLIDQSPLTDEVNDRIFTPVLFGKDGSTGYEEERNPKCMFRQVGGEPDYRYLCVVEGDSAEDARRVATAWRNVLLTRQVTLQAGSPLRTVISGAEPEGHLTDSVNEATRKPQVFFYIRLNAV